MLPALWSICSCASTPPTPSSRQLNEQKLINAELTDAISGENQEEYIAQIARESLGYIYPGEQVYVDISSK